MLLERIWLLIINKHVSSCKICNIGKPERKHPLGLFCPLPILQKPGLDLSLNIVSGLLPLGQCLAASLLVIVDCFPGYVFAKNFNGCCPSNSNFSFSKKSMLDVFGFFPPSVLSDRCPQFVSSVWRKLLEEENIKVNLFSG
jgi:hypothetical protein